MALTKVELELGGRTLIMETGHLAKQADGAVVVRYAESVVLGTAVGAPPREGIDFFPLTVDYREKLNAAGKFPGGFRKREGAPNQKEILTMRNIDRPLRPLFPRNYKDEVQIQCWVLAADGQNDPDVLAGIAASAALSLSSIPFEGPTATVRVGRIEGQFILMPTQAQREYSDLDLVLCGHKDGINMIEVGANQLEESVVADAIRFGYDAIKQIVAKITELAGKVGKEKKFSLIEPAADVVELVNSKLADKLRAAKTTEGNKADRSNAVDRAKESFLAEYFAAPAETATYAQVLAYNQRVKDAKQAIGDLEERITRQVILSGKRTDGRSAGQLREIECLVAVLPRVHGSAVFTRGETQALVTVTLGTGRDEQIVDGLHEEYAEKFYLHYNFPPFSVGEVKRITGPSRRDIGHGKLAERALAPVLPPIEKFPYTVRVVSDILESNGSSSMASACGGTLALMDAGVPIAAPVAGISIGLIAEDGKEIYLTDIQGEEDHFGDMDFKVCGTRTGITAIQLDLKIRGLNIAHVEKAFELAKVNRLQILDKIEAAIAQPRPALSPHAPRMLTTSIHPEKIGRLIGPGGKTIRAIQEATGATIEVEEDGTVFVSAVGAGKAEKAIEEIEKLCAEVQVGKIYTGKVSTIKDFGAFVEVIPGQDGLCHISELTDGYVQRVGDVVSVGDRLRVKVLLIDDQGRVKLSRKAAIAEEGKVDDDAREPVASEAGASGGGDREGGSDRGGERRGGGGGGYGGGGGGGRGRR
ncbi:MAG: polyribonucleotide nucleotidyltransferase [Phycisphaeraceae bacterium]